MWHVAFNSKHLQTTECGHPFLWALCTSLDVPFLKAHTDSSCPATIPLLALRQTFQQEGPLHLCSTYICRFSVPVYQIDYKFWSSCSVTQRGTSFQVVTSISSDKPPFRSPANRFGPNAHSHEDHDLLSACHITTISEATHQPIQTFDA